MKKLFFTALVAAAAIGGAYAGNTKKLVMTAEYGTPGISTCLTDDVDDACTEAEGQRCSTLNTLQPAYELGSNCTIELFRSAPGL